MPFAIWASPTFIANRQSEWTSLRAAASKAATSKSVTHDFFFHTVLGCSGVRSTLLRSDLNLCAGDIFRGASEVPVEAPGQPRAIASTDHLVRIGAGESSRCGMAFSDYVRRHEATLSRRGSDCEKESVAPGSQCCWTNTRPPSSSLIADMSLLGDRNLLSHSN